MKTRLLLTLTFFITIVYTPSAQRPVVKGTVKDNREQPVEYANVYLKGTNYAAVCDQNGFYVLRAPAGEYTIVSSAVGFTTSEKTITIGESGGNIVHMSLEPKVVDVGNVVVDGKSVVKQIKETPYNVVAIDASAFYNSDMDLAKVLDRMSGVKVRETGGLGSESKISLNGFSGRQVKVFLDGIPMETSGSSFRLNNIPVNLADRIEVYKGVVPIELGSDALGGAINIVTRETASTYVDASYSYGSFNTHKSNLGVGYTARSGFFAQINAYQNYSDNSYKIKSHLLNLETSVWSEDEEWFRRFHDQYRNEAVVAKAGVQNKPWADRLLFGVTLSQEKKEIQNGNVMRVVFGEKSTNSNSVIPSMSYIKRNLFVDNLDLSLDANFSKVYLHSLDTSTRNYNWNGDWIQSATKGEGDYTKGKFDNHNLKASGNLTYRIGTRHIFTLNHTYNNYTRKTRDKAANEQNSTAATFMDKTTRRNVSGLAYKYFHNSRLNGSAFAKYYNLDVTGPVMTGNTSSSNPLYKQRSKSHNSLGYGVMATYFLWKEIQLKASYEKAYRLPSETELLGDEVLETGNASLSSEYSNNLNFNLIYDTGFGSDHFIYTEIAFIYRDTRDYIRRTVGLGNTPRTIYTNHGKVNTRGVDLDVRYSWKNRLFVGGNMTWQNVRNRDKYNQDGTVSIITNDPMTNVPYFFSNGDASYIFNGIFGKGSSLNLSYAMNYVHKFYRSWKSEGARLYIPTQLSHDMAVSGSFRNGMYNVTFEVKDITNEMLFDNYNIQKPGRSFSVKLRYFFLRHK